MVEIEDGKISYYEYEATGTKPDVTEDVALKAAAESLQRKYVELHASRKIQDDNMQVEAAAGDDFSKRTSVVQKLKHYIFCAQQGIQLLVEILTHLIASERNALIENKKPLLRLLPLMAKQSDGPFTLDDLKLILATKQEGLKDIADRIENTAEKISKMFEADKNFYQEVITGLKKLGWSLQYHTSPRIGLYICYGFPRATLSQEYPGIARILRKVGTNDKKDSVELIVSHKKKTRIRIRTKKLCAVNSENGLKSSMDMTSTVVHDTRPNAPECTELHQNEIDECDGEGIQEHESKPFDILSSAQKNIFELEVFQNIAKCASSKEIDKGGYLLHNQLNFVISSSSKMISIELLTDKNATSNRDTEDLHDAFLELVVKLKLRTIHSYTPKNIAKDEMPKPSLLTYLISTVTFWDLLAELSELIHICAMKLIRRVRVTVSRVYLASNKVQWTLRLFGREVFAICINMFGKELQMSQPKGVSGTWCTLLPLNIISGSIIRYSGHLISLDISTYGLITGDPYFHISCPEKRLEIDIFLCKHNEQNQELVGLINSFRQVIYALMFS